MKIYMDPNQRFKVKASVRTEYGPKTVPYGSDNAEEFTEKEVKSLVDANPDLEELIQVKGKGTVPEADENNENPESKPE